MASKVGVLQARQVILLALLVDEGPLQTQRLFERAIETGWTAGYENMIKRRSELKLSGLAAPVTPLNGTWAATDLGVAALAEYRVPTGWRVEPQTETQTETKAETKDEGEGPTMATTGERESTGDFMRLSFRRPGNQPNGSVAIPRERFDSWTEYRRANNLTHPAEERELLAFLGGYNARDAQVPSDALIVHWTAKRLAAICAKHGFRYETTRSPEENVVLMLQEATEKAAPGDPLSAIIVAAEALDRLLRETKGRADAAEFRAAEATESAEREVTAAREAALLTEEERADAARFKQFKALIGTVS